MKKITSLLLLFIAVSLLSLKAQKNKNTTPRGYKIDIQFRSTPKDTLFYLISYYGDRRVKVDSAFTSPLQRNKVLFKADTTLLSGVYLVVNQRRMQLFEFVIDKSQQFSVELDTMNTIQTIVVKNSPETALFYEYLKGLTQKQDSVREMEKVLDYAQKTNNPDLFNSKYAEYLNAITKIELYTKTFVEKNPKEIIAKALKMNIEITMPPLPILPDGTKDSTWGWQYYKAHYWDNVDLTDVRMVRTPIFGSKIKTFFDEVVFQHPDSMSVEIDALLDKTRASKEMFRYMLTWLTDKYQQSMVVSHEAVFVHLVERYFLNGEAPWMTENMMRLYTKRAAQLKSVLIGAKIPELIMPDTSGTLLSNYNTGTQFTIMWFWDPDCVHCVEETPKLLQFYHQYKDSLNVTVFAVSLDKDMDRWKSYLVQNKLDWINVGGEKANIDYTMVFDIMATPVIYVFDSNRRIIAKNIPVENLPELFETYKHVFNIKR